MTPSTPPEPDFAILTLPPAARNVRYMVSSKGDGTLYIVGCDTDPPLTRWQHLKAAIGRQP